MSKKRILRIGCHIGHDIFIDIQIDYRDEERDKTEILTQSFTGIKKQDVHEKIFLWLKDIYGMDIEEMLVHRMSLIRQIGKEYMNSPLRG